MRTERHQIDNMLISLTFFEQLLNCAPTFRYNKWLLQCLALTDIVCIMNLEPPCISYFHIFYDYKIFVESFDGKTIITNDFFFFLYRITTITALFISYLLVNEKTYLRTRRVHTQKRFLIFFCRHAKHTANMITKYTKFF